MNTPLNNRNDSLPISPVNLGRLTLLQLSPVNKTRYSAPHRSPGQYSRASHSGSRFLADISSSSDSRTGKFSIANSHDAKPNTYCMWSMKILMAPNTTYFSVAPATAKKKFRLHMHDQWLLIVWSFVWGVNKLEKDFKDLWRLVQKRLIIQHRCCSYRKAKQASTRRF